MIAIIDYGMGNLRNVQKALEYIGEPAVCAAEISVIDRADRVILPGVGAFRDAMSVLKSSGLADAFCAAVAVGKPCLGICLGMQLLFEKSEEFGEHEGLGLLAGKITRLESKGLKIPHMGWNTVKPRGESPLFAGMNKEACFYFVHSLCAQEAEAKYSVGVCQYGNDFAALVCQDNLYGAQFHPEKSGEVGLQLLRNFAAL